MSLCFESDLTPYEIAPDFYQLLQHEVEEGNEFLDENGLKVLRRYYRNVIENPARKRFYCYNWVQRISPMVNLLLSLPEKEDPIRILDAGCGVGTESIFWASLRDDLEILGVDINAARLQTARARLLAHSRRLGHALSVRFSEEDVFKVLDAERFDVVWVMEAISHINPAEAFLKRIAENLGSSGYVVISDSNMLNPVMAWRIFNLRRLGIAHTHVTTEGGTRISYAQERLFTPGRMAEILQGFGFDILRVQISVFFPPALARISFLFRICTVLDHALSHVPLVRNVGGIYTLVARKR